MAPSVFGALVAFGVVAASMALLSRLAPAHRGQRRTWRDTATDVGFLVLNRVVGKPVIRIAVLSSAGVWAAVLAGTLEPRALVTAFSARSPIGAQPLWLQGVELVVLGDLLGYWIHRAFHRESLWRLHAIHHSPERLDWLSSPRVHPLNELLGAMLRIVPLFVLGFRLDALVFTVPSLALYGLLLHANVWWRCGWLRYLVATPAFHRWHHAHPDCLPAHARREGVNFAGLLPLWDLVMGTFHLPEAPPRRCGTAEPVPVGFVAQLRYPLSSGSGSADRCTPPQQAD